MTSQLPPAHRLPYGIADYWSLRHRGYYYVDKTPFIPQLEQAGDFLFLIRPRRFGKSLLQSMLECYYDRARQDEFDELFRDTWIARNPTPEKGEYLVLRFDFSMVDPDPRKLDASFEDHIRISLIDFCQRYATLLPAEKREAILAESNANSRMERLLFELRLSGLKLYLFIDEYDNFANTLLVTEGQHKYRDLTHGGGFFRHFFALFKGGAGQTGGGLSRLFITGVSPITMDDVTSGFNIGGNISLDAEFNALLGFTETELEAMFAAFGHDYRDHRELMRAWYDHYRFAFEAQEDITNSDMALYYLHALHRSGTAPRELIDHNVRIDYGKLRHLVQLDLRLNGNFSRLRQLVEDRQLAGEINPSFPVEALLDQGNFISLLYYFGLLTFAGEVEGAPLLRIPNQTVLRLMYGYLRSGYAEAEVFTADAWEVAERLRLMAYRGEWEGFFDFLAAAVKAQAGVRDYLQGEKMIQGFLLAYLNITPYFIAHSEREMSGGFADLFLAPFFPRYPDMGHAYLIELKYLSREKDTAAARREAITQATTQLRRYGGDERVRRALGPARLHRLILVYSGWELVYRATV